jgi:antitoxin component of RelBE/YafQ-DinJ toxin-antitoxin module
MTATRRPILAARVDPELHRAFGLAARSLGLSTSEAVRVAATAFVGAQSDATPTPAPTTEPARV